MDISRLETLLKPGADVDLPTLYARFRKTSTGGSGLDRFMLFLHEQGHIEAGTLTWVGDAEAVFAGKVATEEHTVVLGDPGSGDSVRIRRRGPVADRFRVIETIGSGGMGSVALARDQNLNRYVAYKQLHADQAAAGEWMERFNFEAQVTAQLDHPNIVPVYSYDAGKGYAMKLVAGRTLEQVLDDARRQRKAGKVDEEHSLAAVLEYFLKVCDAIHYAHSKAVVHRDLKPQNILVGRYNEVYVVDWGIAKLLGTPDGTAPDEGDTTVRLPDEAAAVHPKTQHGDLLGTLGYMSPEQARGDIAAIGPASDVFCLGLILYEVVNLKPAYARGRTREMLVAMVKADIAPMTGLCVQGTAAREMQAIIAKACARVPRDRYASAEDLADDLRRFLRGEEVSARRDGPLQRAARWVGHHREATMLILVGVLVAGAGGVMWSVYARQQAIIAAKAHGEQVAALVTTVAERAQLIERHFLGFEAIVEGLAAASAQLLLRGQPSPERVYTNDDLSAASGGPSDYVFSRAYGQRVTLDQAVFKLAPGVDPAAVAPLMRKLSPLRHYFRQTLFENLAGTAWRTDEARVRAQILERGAPLTWAYVGFAEGVHVAHPGKGGYPAEYDPRKRPWYRYSVDNQGTSWLAPYVDVGGRGLVVPCTRPVRRPDGDLLGVAGVEMTLDHIRENLLDMSGRGEVRATYLVDGTAFVVASSGDTPEKFASGILIETLADLAHYPDQGVVDEILAARSGHVLRSQDGRERVIVYQRLGSIGWYLVAEAAVSAAPAAP